MPGVRGIEILRARGKVHAALLDFTVSAALMPELCTVAPSPLMLERVRSLLATLKEIDLYARTSAGLSSGMAPGQRALPTEWRISDHHAMLRQARVLTERALGNGQLCERFDEVHAVAAAMVGEVYRDRADQTTANLLPRPNQRVGRSL